MQLNLKSVKPDENRYRYYTMFVQQSLFGGFLLTKNWGRIGSKGRTAVAGFSSMKDLEKEVALILRTRQRHGYIVTG